MRQKIIINTSNLQKGGALQVAASFVQEASKISEIDFYIVLGYASSKVILPASYEEAPNLKFITITVQPSQSLFNFLKFRRKMSEIEKKIKPDGVVTVFGPCYWKPLAVHIMGFANGYLLYEDTYFFTIWHGWKTLKYKIKKIIHRYLLKTESLFYWTETTDSKKRLSIFTGKPVDRIIVATNNCSHFFREEKWVRFSQLPLKKATRLLYISSYYPHKGFELMPPILKKLQEAGVSVELVVTINAEDHTRLFSSFDNVINLGNVEPRYCPYIYQQSDIILAPTLLETFSAVYPEAMYMKKPILTTNLPFAKDICGDAALYFDPDSAQDAANKIQLLLNDFSLRDELVAKGLERLSFFDLPSDRFRKILNVIALKK